MRIGVEARRGERRGSWRAARWRRSRRLPAAAGHRCLPQLLQPLDQVAEPLLDVLPEPLEIANALDEDRFEASGDAARGRLRRTSTPRRAGSRTPAPSRPAAATAALLAQAAEHLHRLGIEAPRAALARVRQAVGIETDVTHQGRIGDAGGLADLGQGEQTLGLAATRRAASGGGAAQPARAGGTPAGAGGTADAAATHRQSAAARGGLTRTADRAWRTAATGGRRGLDLARPSWPPRGLGGASRRGLRGAGGGRPAALGAGSS